jgi:hypothetical protein
LLPLCDSQRPMLRLDLTPSFLLLILPIANRSLALGLILGIARMGGIWRGVRVSWHLWTLSHIPVVMKSLRRGLPRNRSCTCVVQ